jgi:hypothetical protein
MKDVVVWISRSISEASPPHLHTPSLETSSLNISKTREKGRRYAGTGQEQDDGADNMKKKQVPAAHSLTWWEIGELRGGGPARADGRSATLYAGLAGLVGQSRNPHHLQLGSLSTRANKGCRETGGELSSFGEFDTSWNGSRLRG